MPRYRVEAQVTVVQYVEDARSAKHAIELAVFDTSSWEIEEDVTEDEITGAAVDDGE